jgi:transcriptional regulator with XRE-family HTH domain
MTREVLAGRVEISVSALRKLEDGTIPWPRADVAIRLAHVFRISVDRLLGREGTGGVRLDERVYLDSVVLIQDAIEEMPVSIPNTALPNPAWLSDRADHAWQVWHRSDRARTSAGRLLPDLIRDGRRAARVLDGADQKNVYRSLAKVYGLCQHMLSWVASERLLWLVADRCMETAIHAGDPKTVAWAAWIVANVWRPTDRDEEALRLTQDACREMEPWLVDDDEARALWGACQLSSATTAAYMGREGDALRALDLASEMAARMPDGYVHPQTLFSPVNATLTGVSVSVALSKPGTATDWASQVDLDALPSVHRCTRLWMETARAYEQRHDWTGVLHSLGQAATLSAETTRCHPQMRQLSRDLVQKSGPLTRRAAVELAHRLDVPI